MPFAQRSNRQRICVGCRVSMPNRSVEELRAGDAVPGKGAKTIACEGCGKDIVSHGQKKRCPDCQLAVKRARLWKQVEGKQQAEQETADRLAKIDASAPLGDSTCERCGTRFMKRGGTAGRFCSRACYEAPAPVDSSSPASVDHGTTEAISAAPRQAPRDPADVVEARDKAVQRFLERHDGVARQKELLAAIPADDPAKTPDAKADALKQALTRLRFKGAIGRTGDTWSLVGAGMAASHA